MAGALTVAVIERDELVATDICEILEDWNKAADPHVFADLAAARANLPGPPAALIMSGNMPHDTRPRNDDLGWLHEQKVVTLDFHDRKSPAWRNLDKPFSPQALIEALEAVLAFPGGP